MDRIARIIVEHSRRILGVTALITIVAALMLLRMDFNADVAAVVLEGNEQGETFKALQAEYATADPINVVATATTGTFRDPESAAALVELRDLLAGTEGVGQVASLVPDVNPLTGQAITPEVVRALPAAALEVLLEQNPLADLLLDDEGVNTLVLVTPADDGLSVARTLDDLTPPAGLELTLSGNPVVFATVLDVLSFVLLFIPPMVIVLLVGTFYATIGDRRLSALAIFPAVIGSIWTFGLIFGLGREVDIVTVIVPIFVIVMGSADGLHFVTHFQEEAETNRDPVARVSSALSHVGVPMILTTISTAAGFLSLLATDVQPIQQLGLFAAIGITFAGIISFFSLPALISRLTIEPRHHNALLGPRVTAGLKRLVRTRIPALTLGVGLLVFAGIFVPRLDVNSDQLFFFKDGDPVRVAFEKTEELFGGATPLAGEFVYDPAAGIGGLADARAAAELLEAQPGVREVFSVADLSTRFPELVEGVLAEELVLPLGDLVSDDGLRFVLFPGDFDSDDLQGWLDVAEEDERISVLTGMPVVWDEIARLVLRAQVVSVSVAFALVAIMLFAAYRRLRETLVSLVPIALTVLTLLGFIAASGIQLNLLTAVISSIVIGVGIDYAIHYVAAIDYARAGGDGYVLRAIDRAGRPIVANALGIAIALSALWLSPLKIHSQVSMIMWVAMTVAALSALLIIPALLPREGVRSE
ncbi:MAG: MMPL family transporter [Acidimicrobiia bacterium]|nr:MMPL family transporter [Acidimicrobiia bacterium]